MRTCTFFLFLRITVSALSIVYTHKHTHIHNIYGLDGLAQTLPTTYIYAYIMAMPMPLSDDLFLVYMGIDRIIHITCTFRDRFV